jgi:hypothetical protein
MLKGNYNSLPRNGTKKKRRQSPGQGKKPLIQFPTKHGKRANFDVVMEKMKIKNSLTAYDLMEKALS